MGGGIKEPCTELVVSVVPGLGNCATSCMDGGGGTEAKVRLSAVVVAS